MTTDHATAQQAIEAAQRAASEAAARAVEAELLGQVYRAGVADESLARVIARGLVGADAAAVKEALEKLPRPAAPAAAPLVTLPSPGPVADDLPTDPAKWRERLIRVADRLNNNKG